MTLIVAFGQAMLCIIAVEPSHTPLRIITLLISLPLKWQGP